MNGNGKKKDVKPKGTYATFNGKRYMSLGGGNWQGAPKPDLKYKPRKMKPKTNYKSTGSSKGKPSKRKY